MKIQQSNVSIDNEHNSVFQSVEKRTEVTLDENPSPSLSPTPLQPSIERKTDSADIEIEDNAKTFILKLLVQKLVGKEIDWYEADDMNNIKDLEIETPNETTTSNPTHVIIEKLNHESQTNAFSLKGNIKLENGQHIDFAFKLNFEQSHTRYQRTTEAIEMKDPLIISFTNKAVSLDKSSWEFDLDADGEKDEFAHLNKGYGYLALDLNSNGRIDDGTELFGALSGNGFNDLIQYDEDGNGFIDENDAVFENLKVWVKNAGEDKLLSLEEAGIGAIATHNVDTPFNLRNGDDLTGSIRKSGFYLDNQGNAGLMQQIDFVV